VPYYAIFAIMCAVSLGSEFHHGTAQCLIAQPVARRQIWCEKLLVLFVMVMSVAILGSLVGYLRWTILRVRLQWDEVTSPRLWDNMVIPPLIVGVLTLCIGPWFACVARQQIHA